MSNGDGSVKILWPRLLRVLAPVTLATVILTAVIVIAAARFIVFPVYADTVSILLENLSRRINAGDGNPAELAEILTTARKGKFAYLIGRPEAVSFRDESIENPENLLRQLLAGLPRNESTRVRISGVGPTLRLEGISRLDQGRFLVVVERWNSFAALYLRVFLGGLGLVLVGVALAVGLSSWLIFSPLWLRLKGLEKALRRYSLGERDLRLELDQGVADDGFLLVHFEFNRMADRILKMELERQRRAAAERALLAGLAHDLNTPMTIIRGQAENLVEHSRFLSRDEQKQRLSEILAQSLYMQALVDDLLTQAKAELAVLKVNPEPVDLAELYDTIVDTFHYPATRIGVVLIADDQGLSVWADPLRLRQILTNLIRNALTHARSLTCIELLAEKAEGGVNVVVRDDGAGLDESLAADIFKAGTRGADNEVKGWGLGLAVVKMLAEAHNGCCRVDSAPGTGTSFTVWFPDKPL